MKKHIIVTSDDLSDFQGQVDSYLNQGWFVAHLAAATASRGLYDPIILNNAFIAILEYPND